MMNLHRRAVAMLLWTAPLAWAQSVSEATVRSIQSSPATAAHALEPPAGPGKEAWASRRLSTTSLRIIELPDETVLGKRGRRHHALTWRNDTLSSALDNAGLGHAECRNRVRLPTRWRSAPGAEPGMQVQLQIAIGCSF